MSPDFSPPPGTGAFRPDDESDDRFRPGDHMSGWNIAVDRALENIGRSPGNYSTSISLNATVRVENPGHVIEYIATVS